jgi:sugar lactone lactonase YvrE
MTEQKTGTPSKASLLYPAANLLGEGPVWHHARQSFFWVDIEGKKLNELTWRSKAVQTWPMPQRIGMVAPCDDDTNLLVALEDGLSLFNPQNETRQHLVHIEKERPENRPNDGKCDSEGRLWLGTMNAGTEENSGSLYCINKTAATQQLTALTISNGMAWSGDNKYFYFIDSVLQRVDQYLFDAPPGAITFDRVAVEIPATMGLPDGMTVDEEGMLWVAQWGGFCVCRWNPHTGALLHKIEVPVPQVTSCTFGGENLDQLLITSASVGLSKEDMATYPQSGHLFLARPGVRGMLPNKFKHSNDITLK